MGSRRGKTNKFVWKVRAQGPTSPGQVALKNAKKKRKLRGKVRAQRKNVPVDTCGHMRVPNVQPLSPTS